ncbi:MAG: phospholipase D family protein [Thermaurantiacus tibetensis]
MAGPLALLLLLLLALVGAGLLLRLLNPLPALEPRPLSSARRPDGSARLDQLFDPLEAANPDLDGVAPLADPLEAFAARCALIRLADRSLDLQYYIWEDDVAGRLLLRELMAAADRGVRVRLLLDDNGTTGLDPVLAALETHPRVEVRLFNPFTLRRPKLLGYLIHPVRLNRRMHNKALIADSRALIAGGRNIGDVYFGAGEEGLFVDLDVLAAGPAARALAADFDRYWQAPTSYTLDRLLPPAPPDALDWLRARCAAEAEGDFARATQAIVEAGGLANDLGELALSLEWTRARLVSDEPVKALGRGESRRLVGARLAELIGRPARSFTLVSPYFVPTDSGRARLVEMATGGVEVSILTNALEATDVPVVHAGYSRHRRALVRAGVGLWELKRRADTPLRLGLGLRLGSGRSRRPALASSATSLHAKTFEVDGQRLFVGSFNFDPRSFRLNTELGLLIDSPRMAAELHALVASGFAQQAYRLALAPDGRRLHWLETSETGETVHVTEPGTRPHQRAAMTVLSWLPIDWLL